MCGIAGFYAPAGLDPAAAEVTVRAMADALVHRGPDDAGVWADPAGIALGHRRLAILDTSSLGHQPMASASGRFTITFNGEVYNFADLRAQLSARGYPFRSRSDTEVLLASVELDGVDATLRRLRGMFAFGLWDARERRLVLARDRLGEKPLYYGWLDGGTRLVFGSELRALRAHPGCPSTVDRGALVQYMRYGFVPSPSSIYAGIRRVPAGTSITFAADARNAAPVAYYSMAAVAEAGLAEPLDVDLAGASALVEAELGRVVRGQMVADVPLGAFLSGGVDSSAIVALMQASSSRRIKTFSIGFDEPGYDEAGYARQVAQHLGTDHTEVYVSAAQALEVIPQLPGIYDEPFADSSQIPTVLIARIARQHVTVALTGDAGDEVFGGYPRYALARKLAPLWRLPGRRAVVEVAHRALDRLAAADPAPTWSQRAVDWARRRTSYLRVRDADGFYAAYMSVATEPERIVLGGREPRDLLPLEPQILAGGSAIERAMLADSLHYLPDDILVKVDCAAMSTSLETRVPFLDADLVALAWRLPGATKLGGPHGKLVLRHLLGRHIPSALIDRPKMGFAVPVREWLRGPLFDWAEALLDERRLRREGFLDAGFVRRRWRAYLAGVSDWHAPLWHILQWQAWLETYGGAAGGA